jgi:broad specificity phosphatase PhoE
MSTDPFEVDGNALRKNGKIHQRHGAWRSFVPFKAPVPNIDLRLIVSRHGDRMDTTYGSDWYQQVFQGYTSASGQLYQNPALPHSLPRRRNSFQYILDPPITREGQQKATLLGKQLLARYGSIDQCFSSPASRCVMSADAILRSTSSQPARIAIDPFLFEPLAWNTALLMFQNVTPFLSIHDWVHAGFRINRSYVPVGQELNVNEKESDYYARSMMMFDQMTNRNYRAHVQQPRPTNILVLGHSASPVIFNVIASGVPFDLDKFNKSCEKISFLDTLILERDARTKKWLKPILLPLAQVLR